MRSALYPGMVTHQRLRPRRHRLEYRVFCLLIDLDEAALSGRRFGLLGVNRPGILSFREADHGDGVTPLKAWATRLLREAGIAYDGGPVDLLCYPRMFGFVFNPLSVFFCRNRDGNLAAVLYEVHNTHGERHTYVMPAGSGPVVRHEAAKTFFVSPFMPMDCLYRFRIRPPADRVDVSIFEDDAHGPLLTARFTGEREELSDGVLVRMLLGYPLMTLKVVAAIHWEAVKLVLKGIPLHNWRRAARRIEATAPLSADESTRVAAQEEIA